VHRELSAQGEAVSRKRVVRLMQQECAFFDEPQGGWCYADSQEDCAKSLGCKQIGNCYLPPGSTERNAWCRPASDADCRQSEICKTEGRCRVHYGGENSCVK
jgi:hypothetical protein